MINILADETARTSAIEYFWEKLGQGNSLASLVLRAVNFDSGTVASLCPNSYDRLEITEFDRGHTIGRASPQPFKIGRVSGLAIPKVTMQEELAELICTYLDFEGVCLIENPLARLGDPWLDRAISRFATYESEIYHLVASPDCDAGKVLQAIVESSYSPLSWGALGRIPMNCLISDLNGVGLRSEGLKKFAENVRCLFVSAYDGEGSLVWQT